MKSLTHRFSLLSLLLGCLYLFYLKPFDNDFQKYNQSNTQQSEPAPKAKNKNKQTANYNNKIIIDNPTPPFDNDKRPTLKKTNPKDKK